MISIREKLSIWAAAMAWFHENYGESMALQGACLYLNQAAMRELALRGHRVVLQAGDMHWRMVDDAHDDGRSATHFGYEFDLSQPFSQGALARGLFPECHVWAALPEERCIVDFSTAYLSTVARTRHGYVWTAPEPPLYVFGGIPEGAVYVPKVEAIKFVWRFIAEKMATPEQRETIDQALASRVLV